MGKPELLSPAGDRERLDMALAYGADAVYLAGNAYGMRAFAGNFGREGLAEAVKAAHAQDVSLLPIIWILNGGGTLLAYSQRPTTFRFQNALRFAAQIFTTLLRMN